MTTPIIDLHFHMLAKDDASGCQLSDYARHQPAGWIANLLLGTLDEELLDLMFPRRSGAAPDRLSSELIRRRLLREIRDSKLVDGVVLLALDRVHDRAGNPVRSDVVTTNDYVRTVITEYGAEAGSKRLYLGASVHPYRRDALAQLEAAKAMGAVLIKWIPSSQKFDPSDPRLHGYYQKLAELSLPLLCHGGPQGAIPDSPQDERYNRPSLLRPALERNVTVIVAHCAAPYLPRSVDATQANRVPELLELFQEAEGHQWHLYADTSALLLSSVRAAAVRTLLKRVNPERFVYGSDFPIPTGDLTLWQLRRGWRPSLAWRAARTKNLLDKDVLAKRSVRLPESIFRNSAKVLGL
jgi:predicted TIM-barrel fold metal-dependent hydrolase